MNKAYSIDEHIHRYGMWAASRAASKSLLSNSQIQHLIERSGLREGISMLRKSNPDHEQYKKWLLMQCDKIIEAFKGRHTDSVKKKRISHGIAAKIISIYIKTVEVLPEKGESALSKIAFPPIDSFLIKRINEVHNLKLDTRWSLFTWDQYSKTIDEIKVLYENQPMWQVESEWNLGESKVIITDKLT